MGFDLSVRFSDPNWYQHNRSHVADLARALPSALDASPGPDEIWLKDPKSSDLWAYEARILPKKDALLIEVMGFSSVFHHDIREFMARLSRECTAELVDDDGDPI